MSTTAMSASPKPAPKPARRLLVRMNSTLFHCLGAAVLLEHAAAAAAACLPGTQSHVMQSPERRKCAQWLLGYVQSTWPEFGWSAACVSIVAARGPLPAQPFTSSGIVASDHMALFYRALSAIAEDPEVCGVLKQIASIEESRRDDMTTSARPGAAGSLCRAQSTRAYVEHMRNRVVRRAFDLLQRHWTDTPPFPAPDYDAFLLRAYALLATHLRLDWTRRLLYRGWLKSRASYAIRSAVAGLRARDVAIETRMQEFTVGRACALPPASMVR